MFRRELAALWLAVNKTDVLDAAKDGALVELRSDVDKVRHGPKFIKRHKGRGQKYAAVYRGCRCDVGLRSSRRRTRPSAVSSRRWTASSRKQVGRAPGPDCMDFWSLKQRTQTKRRREGRTHTHKDMVILPAAAEGIELVPTRVKGSEKPAAVAGAERTETELAKRKEEPRPAARVRVEKKGPMNLEEVGVCSVEG